MNGELTGVEQTGEATVSAPASERLGERLISAGKLSARDLEQALSAQGEMQDLLGRILLRLGLLSESDLCAVLAEQLGVPLVLAADFPADALIVDGLTPEYMRAHRVLVLGVEQGVLQVAMAVPQDSFIRKAIGLGTGMRAEPRLALESEIDSALQRYFEESSEEDDELGAGAESGDSEFVEHLRDLATEAPVIRLVNQIVGRVVDMRASDIHLEPFEAGLQVRYRVDGVLQSADPIATDLAAAVTSRVKLLAHLNIAERRLPQDGRIKTRVRGHELDLRISTLPTVYGESVVMRVLDRASIRLDLEDMGFSADTLEVFQTLLARPHGIVLVTGPTGSGKTTTLYAALAKMDADSLKIVTVEDPVEYQLNGVNQVQALPQIGLSFAHALRSILRQDPDIIMIGEMRDGETAQIAVQSALTGHLVLSTLHTNTAAGAIVRLEDMGVERYLITSTVNGVLAQRLLRKLCPACKEQVELPQAEMERTGLGAFMAKGKRSVYAARGCPQCKETGYLGRTSIHELFVMSSAAHLAILDGADATTLQAVAKRDGMLTLYEDGLRKVAAGVSSLEEVLRVTQDQSNA